MFTRTFGAAGGLVGAFALVVGCGLMGAGTARQEVTTGPVTPQGPPPAENDVWQATTVVSGLARPWGMVWLPDGRMLVTERGGRVRMVVGGRLAEQPVAGAPPVLARGQGGLLDISLHPDFARNGWVYTTLATGTPEANRTAVARGVLRGDRLEDVRVIYQVPQPKSGGQHFGSRILWLPDKTFLVSIGDGGNPPSAIDGTLTRFLAQRLDSAIGKVLRLDENGRAPQDNPFVGRPGALPEIWSLGHRNIQGMARDPQTGRIYANEHGARGGDEVNMLEAGKNYGWPEVTYSIEYSGRPITDLRTKPGMVDPMVVWTPCPAPSGLLFYTGDVFPEWRGSLFSGGLVGQDVRRIRLDAAGRAVGQTQLRFPSRVRDVRQGPDGFIYLLTDEENGELIRIEPKP